MSALALPNYLEASAIATTRAIADGMNGVTPELRQHALRKVRRAIRRGQVPPSVAVEALAQGDVGIASMFPIGELPNTPDIPVGCGIAAPDAARSTLVKSCRWFVEHALRRGVAPQGALEVIASPDSSTVEVASVVLATWNALLESYRPDWAPACVGDPSPSVFALPAIFDGQVGNDGVVISTRSISRLFVEADQPGFDLLKFALSKLDAAMPFGVMGSDPVAGREYFVQYGLGDELQTDARNLMAWPDGANTPVIHDMEGLANLLDGLGYDGELAEEYAESLTADEAFSRRFEAVPDEATMREAIIQSAASAPMAAAAQHVLVLAERLAALSCKRVDSQHLSYGLPVHLIATYGDDARQGEISNLIDNECSEADPGLHIPSLSTKPAELDRQLACLVAEMIIADLAYALVYSAS